MNRRQRRDERLHRAVAALAAGPADLDRTFLLPGTSYRQLYASADFLHRIMGETAGPIGLCTESRAAIAAALIAALWSGRPLVLPHAVSESAIDRMHRQTNFHLAVADRGQAVPEGVRRIVPEASGDPSAGAGRPRPAPEIEWVRLFTGGSTGRPRIWSKSIQNLVGESAHLVEAFGFSPEDRVSATVPAFHIYGLLYSLLAPMIAAASVSAAAPSFPGEIAADMESCGASVLVCVPVHYRAMREAGRYGRRLRLAFSSAGPLDSEDASAFYSGTGTGVTEIYGSTETGGIASRCRAAGQSAYYPFAPVDCKIAGGRLHVRSAFLSPELPVDADGFFRTGDRAAPGPEGGFVLGGRTDGVVKVAGKRVDAEEVREKIRGLAGVRDAVVTFIPGEAGMHRGLVALVEGGIEADRVRRHLAGCLEPYAVPRRIRVVEKIPVTAAGKLDRERALALLSS